MFFNKDDYADGVTRSCVRVRTRDGGGGEGESEGNREGKRLGVRERVRKNRT